MHIPTDRVHRCVGLSLAAWLTSESPLRSADRLVSPCHRPPMKPFTAASRRRAVAVAGLALSVAAINCRDDSRVEDCPFDVTLNPASATLPTGGSVTVGITLTDAGRSGFPINLGLFNAPAGVSSSFAPISGSPRTLTLSNVSLSPGIYSFFVEGSRLDMSDDGTTGTCWTERAEFTLTVPDRFTRTPFTVVPDAFEIRFNRAGDMFVANSGVSQGNAPSGPIRRVLADGSVSDHSTAIADPDALIVDTLGSIASQIGAILVGGSLDFANDINHLTEVAPDGSTTTELLQASSPNLSNPSSFAFLPDATLLITNFDDNSISRLSNAGGLQLAPFYQANDAPTGMISVEVHAGSVFVVTGGGALAQLDLSGSEISQNIWPTSLDGAPAKIAADVGGNFGNRLLIVSSARQLVAYDPGTNAFERLGAFTFDNPVFGMTVSPVDGALYVSESVSGQIWRVVATP